MGRDGTDRVEGAVARGVGDKSVIGTTTSVIVGGARVEYAVTTLAMTTVEIGDMVDDGVQSEERDEVWSAMVNGRLEGAKKVKVGQGTTSVIVVTGIVVVSIMIPGFISCSLGRGNAQACQQTREKVRVVSRMSIAGLQWSHGVERGGR